jgi:phage terminase large subunit-like protein
MPTTKGTGSSLEPASPAEMAATIDGFVAGWVEEGLVEATVWDGRPLIETPLPTGDGIVFDPERVVRVLRFFMLLRQLVGRWADRPFVLLDWQVRYLVAPVFGIVRDGHRVIRTVWFEIPRKNGKSTLCSGLGLYLVAADREPAAQVYAAAGSKEQARLVFEPARLMALKSKALRKRFGRKIMKSLIEHPTTGSIFRAVASTAELAHGLNVHGAIIDEVHVHKSPDLVDALETGTGSRDQPLIVFITTADDGSDGSVYDSKREYVEGVASGRLEDESFFGVVFGVDREAEGFDAFSVDTQRAANPGYGVTVMTDYLARKAKEAQSSPALLNRYLRLHLNVRTRQTVKWLDLARWDHGRWLTESDDPAEAARQVFNERSAHGGLDLSATSDFTAFVFGTSLDGLELEGVGPGAVAVWPMFWIPEEQLHRLEDQTGMPLTRWTRQGFLKLTEGNVVDYGQVRADIKTERDRLGCRVGSIAFDRWNASETVIELEKDGLEMYPMGQGYASMSQPSKEFERLVHASAGEDARLVHFGHPVLRWMADCVEVRQDEAGNIKPVKPDRRASAKRVDGIQAGVMALDRVLRGPRPKRSAYEDHGLEVA